MVMYINLLPIVMTVISLLSVGVYAKDLVNSEKIQLFILPVIFLILLYNSPSGLVLYWTLNNLFSVGKNYVLRTLPIKNFSRKYQYNFSYYIAILNAILLVTWYFPLKIYFSDPDFFTLNKYQFFVETLQLICVVLAIFVYLKLVVPTWLELCLERIVVGISLSISIYAAYNFFDTGVLDGFSLTNAQNLTHQKYAPIIVDNLILFIVLVVVIFIKYRKILNYLFIATILAVVGVSGYDILVKSRTLYDTKTTELYSSDFRALPNYAKEFLSFSREGKNIVVIMADTFEGQHMRKIIHNDPEIKKLLDGFVWYENAITLGGRTFFGEPAIHGGHDFSPFAINERSDHINSVTDEIAKSYKTFIDEFSAQGFNVQILGPSYTTCEKINFHAENDMDFCKDYSYQLDFIDYFVNKNNISNLSDSFKVSRFLEAFALYNVVPYSLRTFIYDDASWLNTVAFTRSVAFDYKNYAFISSMADISVIKSDAPTLKYISTEYTHPSWLLGSDCLSIKEENKLRENAIKHDEDGVYTEQVSIETCFLKNMSAWIDWLKSEGVFDNTMIVIVSDHGGYNDPKLAQTVGVDLTVVAHLQNTDLKLPYPGNPGSLLLIKDFNNNNEFTIENDYLMSNADTLAIICAQIGGCDGVSKDPRDRKEKGRVLRHMWSIESTPGRHPLKKYDIDIEFEVTDDIYVKDNWRQIQPE